VLEEVVPERLTLDQVIRNDRANGKSRIAWAAAAAVVAFLAGGASGWFAHGTSIGTRPNSVAVANGALDAYRLYVVEVRHPVEVPGTERQHMTQWLSRRVGEDLRVPDLQSIGLKLVGGRLLPGPTGAAAFYMYEGASGERFTIYCAKASAPPTAFRYTTGERAAAVYWADGKVAYVVSGPADRERLEKVAKAAYEQMERDDAKRS
jgi:anti-sigma factor RsiW